MKTRISQNDWAIFITGITAFMFGIVALINKFLGLPFYEPLQTAVLILILNGMLVISGNKK